MFKQFKTTRRVKKLLSSWGGDLSNPSPIDHIVVTELIFLYGIRKLDTIFSSKYVCADASLLSTLYIAKHIQKAGADELTIATLLKTAFLGISYAFEIDKSELKKMQINRFDRFEPLIEKMENLEPLIEEAALLFAYDLEHKKYVPFSEDSPLIIFDVFTGLKIESDTAKYFNALIPLLLQHLA
ncbi:MAG: hypothetical protein GX337_00695 [Christensenellaceae bacterium]|nr:hypothetical protein [Christensenellaceae bacterium]